mgnify:CR=1 FL=1
MKVNKYCEVYKKWNQNYRIIIFYTLKKVNWMPLKIKRGVMKCAQDKVIITNLRVKRLMQEEIFESFKGSINSVLAEASNCSGSPS